MLQLQLMEPEQQQNYEAANMPSKTSLLAHFLLPSWMEFLAYTIISFVFLVACNLWALLQVLTGDASLSSLQVSNALTTYKERFDSIFNTPVFASASTFLFWGIIGCVAYMVAFVLKSYLERMYEEKQASHNIQPRYIKGGGYWKSVAGHNIFFACTVLVTIAFLIVSLGIFVPQSITLFSRGLASWFSWQSIIAFLGSTLALVLLIQVGRILSHLIHSSWKIYFATED